MGTGPRGLSVAPCCISAQPRAGGTSTTQRTASLEGSALCAAKYSLQIPSPAYKILRFPQTRCRILFIFAAQQAAAPRLGQSQLSPLLQAAPSERFSTDPVPSEGIWGLCPSSEGFVPTQGALSPWGELQGKGSSSSHPSPASFLGRPRAPGAGSRQLSNFTGWSSLRGWSFVSRSCFSSRLRIPCHHCWQPRSCRVRTAPRCQEHHGTGRRGTGYNQKPDAGKTGFKRKKKTIKYQEEKH